MKKLIYLPILVVIISLLNNSCCTKKDCGYKNYPNIRIESEFASYFDLFKVDTTINEIIDSNRYFGSYFYLGYSEAEDIRKYTYIIKRNSNLIDTISKIEFDLIEYMNDCNTCFLVNNSSTAIDYTNLKLKLNNHLLLNNDHIVLDN